MNRRDFLAESAKFALAAAGGECMAANSNFSPPALPRCTLTPLPEQQTMFQLGGKETARWHFGSQYPRPFFYPFNGPSGSSLTRMGHPGAPNHDHHRSIWFAHNSVNGVDFWGENTAARIRQKEWLCYEDGAAQCIMAVRLGWFPEPSVEAMEQIVVAIARPREKGGHTLELQSTFRAISAPVRLGRTNFGFLAVRVAKSISEHFGGGRLTDSEGRQTETAIFGKRALWMDYSGRATDTAIEGITYFDHPDNPGHPTHWHVREDGWMGAALCLAEERIIAPGEPLKLRYLLHAHGGPLNAGGAAKVFAEFTKAKLPGWKSTPAKPSIVNTNCAKAANDAGAVKPDCLSPMLFAGEMSRRPRSPADRASPHQSARSLGRFSKIFASRIIFLLTLRESLSTTGAQLGRDLSKEVSFSLWWSGGRRCVLRNWSRECSFRLLPLHSPAIRPSLPRRKLPLSSSTNFLIPKPRIPISHLYRRLPRRSTACSKARICSPDSRRSLSNRARCSKAAEIFPTSKIMAR